MSFSLSFPILIVLFASRLRLVCLATLQRPYFATYFGNVL
jgi:hypothetical protein